MASEQSSRACLHGSRSIRRQHPPTAKDAIGEETSRRVTSDDRRVSSGMAGDHGHTAVETLERSQTVESGTSNLLGRALRRAKSRPPQSILVNSIYPSQILGWNLLLIRIKAESGLLWHFQRPLGHGMNQGIGPDSWTHDEN